MSSDSAMLQESVPEPETGAQSPIPTSPIAAHQEAANMTSEHNFPDMSSDSAMLQESVPEPETGAQSPIPTPPIDAHQEAANMTSEHNFPDMSSDSAMLQESVPEPETGAQSPIPTPPIDAHQEAANMTSEHNFSDRSSDSAMLQESVPEPETGAHSPIPTPPIAAHQEADNMTSEHLSVRQAKAVKKTYTAVLKVPEIRYSSLSSDEIKAKKDKINHEKEISILKMEGRIKTFCQTYLLPDPSTNIHCKIPKDTPWLGSREEGSDQSHVINAAVPGSKRTEVGSDAIPLNLKEFHYFYIDTGIASWRAAVTGEKEAARLQTVQKDSSFKEYTWRLSNLVYKGKRLMRLMAKDKNEKCGPLPLFNKPTVLQDLVFEMPVEPEFYRHEGIPISRAVRMLFQTADMEAFEKVYSSKGRDRLKKLSRKDGSNNSLVELTRAEPMIGERTEHETDDDQEKEKLRALESSQ